MNPIEKINLIIIEAKLNDSRKHEHDVSSSINGLYSNSAINKNRIGKIISDSLEGTSINSVLNTSVFVNNLKINAKKDSMNSEKINNKFNGSIKDMKSTDDYNIKYKQISGSSTTEGKYQSEQVK